MKAAIQYDFFCSHCGATMRLPAETLGNIFGPPALRTMDAASVAVVCPQCKQVGNHSLLQNSADRHSLDQAVLAAPVGETVFLKWLKCEKATCKTPLPLFAVWTTTTTEEERKADTKTWKWDGLHCPQGHAIPAPVILYYPEE